MLAAAEPRDDTGRVSKGRRIAILGDMKELGSTSAALHAGMADHPSMAKIDVIHCVGPMMSELANALPAAKLGLSTETAEEMARKIAPRLDSGDVVLVKGSLSMQLAQVVDAIRKMDHPQLTEASQQ